MFLLLSLAGRAVVFLFENRVRLNGFEFSLEVVDGVAVCATVGAAAGVGEVVPIVFGFFAVAAPGVGILVISR